MQLRASYIAQTLEDVTAAWHLLYKVYLEAGYIKPNPLEIHINPKAITKETLVVLNKIGNEVVGTVSGVTDCLGILPLDSIYHNELQDLRKNGAILTEICLFADISFFDKRYRSRDTLLDMIAYVFTFGVMMNCTHFVCGVNPRFTKMYQHIFGFQQIGDVKLYCGVDQMPVVLLVADFENMLEKGLTNPALDYFIRHPKIIRDRFVMHADVFNQGVSSGENY